MAQSSQVASNGAHYDMWVGDVGFLPKDKCVADRSFLSGYSSCDHALHAHFPFSRVLISEYD